jgi:Zn-dependent protease
MVFRMASAYHIGRVLGIPVKVHVTLIIFLPIIAVQIAKVAGSGSLLWGFLAATGLFASVALHELGHSVVALAKGIRVRQILLLPIGGLAALDYMPENPRDEFQIAAAGPLVSFALAVFFGILVWLFGSPEPGWIVLTWMVLGGMNFMLATFNLLPSFPMDGGRIFRAWLTPRVGRVAATRIAAKTGRFMAIVFGVWGLLPPFNLLMIAIAVFIYMAAGSEYRMVVMQDRMRRPFGDWPFQPVTPAPEPEEEETIQVSPPPYARTRPDPRAWWTNAKRRQQDLFDQLFKDWSKD